VKEGRRLAYPTTGSLLPRAKDRLRLFRKLFKNVLSKTSFFDQAFFLKERLRVNSTGGILTLLLIRLRGTHPHPNEFGCIPVRELAAKCKHSLTKTATTSSIFV
jgi:hypothetical protein